MDDLGEGAAGDFVAIGGDIIQGRIIFCARQIKFFFFFDSTIVIAIDDGRVAFAKVGGTVCLVTGAVSRDILIFDLVWVIASSFNCGTDRSTGAFSINVCVDNGIAGAAVDVDVTGTATIRIYSSANCRAGVTGSIIWVGRIIRTIGVDRIYSAAGDVDGCCGIIVTGGISNRRNIMGTDGGNVGILFNIDREIRKAAIPTSTNGAVSLTGFCMYGAFPEIVIVVGSLGRPT